MIVTCKLLTEHHLECLSLKGSSESTHVKMPYFWKSRALAQIKSNRIGCVETSGGGGGGGT